MTPFGNAGGLLGLDEEQLKKLMAQFAVTPEMKRSANYEGLVAMGLGIMANARKGREFEGIGQAGMGALQYRNDSLDRIVKERGQALTQGMGAMKLGKEMDSLDLQKKLMNGEDPGVPSGATGGGAPAPLPPMMGPPGPNDVPAPAASPAGDTAPNLTKLTLMQRAANLGVAEPVRLALAGGGPEGWRKAADIIATASKPHFGQGVNPILRNPANGVFEVHRPEGMTQIQAEQAGAVEEAKQKAIAANDLVKVMVGNREIQMSRADALRQLGQQASSLPSAAPPKGNVSFNFAPGTGPSPPQMAEIQKDMSGQPSGFSPAATKGQLGLSADPIEQDRLKQAVLTEAQAKREVNTGAIGQIDKAYPDVSAHASVNIPVIHEARRALDSGILTGAGANFGLKLGSVLSQAGFAGADAPVENTQVFMKTQARQVLGIIKMLGSGSGISDADREYAAGIVGGDITLNEGSLRRLLDISERAQRSAIGAHNTRVKQASSVMGNPDIGALYNVEAPGAYMRSDKPQATTPQRESAAPAGPNSVTAPNGKTYSFPSPAAAQAFRKKFSIQ